MLPSPLKEFEGRKSDLDSLIGHHKERRREISRIRGQDRRILGPVMLFVYGPPGVGKTALVRQAAHRLRRRYWHGQIYVNMGLASGSKPTTDILREMLVALGVDETELVGAEPQYLTKLFRTITARRRLLIVLDAARDPAQVRTVLPANPRCAVLVTSRANLADVGEYHQRLETPTAADAVSILHAYASTGESSTVASAVDPEVYAELVEQCGRQPLALRAAGERAKVSHDGPTSVSNRLRTSSDRLLSLSFEDRDPGVRIASEYRKLKPEARQALQVLGTVPAASFVPWVLQPMLDIDLRQAASLMASLSNAGLLDELGSDPSGFARYRISPLIKLFAQNEYRKAVARISGSGESPLLQAPERLRKAMVELAAQAMAVADFDLRDALALRNTLAVPPHWLPGILNWTDRVAYHADFWIREEFPNLVQAIREAHLQGTDIVAGKLAEYLGDLDVTYPFDDQVRQAFDYVCERPAQALQDGSRDLPAVLAAKGSCLLVAERYAEAFAVLSAAALKAGSAHPDVSARAWRKIGQGRQRLGHYSEARGAYEHALVDARQAGGMQDEVKVLELLLAENRALTEPDQWSKPLPDSHGTGGSSYQFIEQVVRARDACRHGDGEACLKAIGKASEAISGYDNSALSLKQLRLEAILCQRRLSPQAQVNLIMSAANLVISAGSVGAFISTAEARIALAQALLANGQVDRCLAAIDKVRASDFGVEVPRIRALAEHVRGRALIASKDDKGACVALTSAVEGFQMIGEHRSEAQSRLILGVTQLRLGDHLAAYANLWSAATAFHLCDDVRQLRQVLALLARHSIVAPLQIGRTLFGVSIKNW
jgi:tetratricopeptide (TPR) repeat protein